jgi:hypothetical protein
LPQKKRRFPPGMTNKRQLARPRRDLIKNRSQGLKEALSKP